MQISKKQTKIVATLGPSINSKAILEEMMIAGVNVFRINFSHAEYDDVLKTVKIIRELSDTKGYHIGILGDLQGPKLRVGKMNEGVHLSVGDEFTFTTEQCEGTQQKAFMTYQNFPKDVKAGEQVLVDDGKLLFEVLTTDQSKNVVTKVLRGGALKSKKGVNLPNTNISLPALTEKDKKDADFCCKIEVDWIALSFVRNAEDINELRALIEKSSEHQIPIIAKIEKPEALRNIDKIIKCSNGVMVARGDLGVEIPMQKVPLIQKKIVRKAKEAAIPVIIATQMMESMINHEVPTRAEINDVANSVMDGADAVMLSGETSVGLFPVEVIKQVRKVIESVENSPLIKIPSEYIKCVDDRFVTKSICHSAVLIANSTEAELITTITNTGFTAFHISSWRPASNILVFSSNNRILSMLNLLWGVKGIYYDKFVSTDETIKDINNIAYEKGYIENNDFVVNVTSMPVIERGMANTIRITHYKNDAQSSDS
jgi:pyruvate kinase